jgi:hypothetical protein
LEIDRWLKTHPYTITDDLDPDTGDNVVRTELTASPPPIIPQIIGDCLYNLRASLDHLVYALALANKPSLTDTEMTETAFPIFKTEAGFQTRGRGKIKHVSPEAHTIIDSLQPYRTWHAATAQWLWLLEKLENIDKHRKLLITIGVYHGTRITIPPDTRMELFEPSNRVRPLKNEAEIARYRLVNVSDGSRVKVDFQPSFFVTFGDGQPADGGNVVVVLNRIHDHIVKIVLPALRGFIR